MYTVIYFNNGNKQWKPILTSFSHYQEAAGKQAELTRMGYYSLIHDTNQLASMGFPEGPPEALAQWEHANIHMKDYCGCKV